MILLQAINTVQLTKLFLITFIVLVSVSCAKKPSRYELKASVITTKGYGVVLYDFPISKSTQYRSDVDPDKPEIRITPTIPGGYDTLVLLPPLKGYEGRKLPDKISLKYQYADIGACSIDYSGIPQTLHNQQLSSRYSVHYFTKKNCKEWRLLPDKIYQKELDLTDLKGSEEYRLFGRKNQSGSRLGLTVLIEFLDNGEVNVRGENTIHNPWK
ncbi:hypothetical protein TDB9533_01055 [Thalassocella blandensis]|nr:hypothetical protein TDB9533_01055 [Thalassocella blandensis]